MRVYYGWVIVATLFFVSLTSAATAGFTFGLFVLPMGNDLGLSRAVLGWTQSARLAANGLSSLAIGPLIDRYGTRILIPIAGGISAIALLTISRSSSLWIIIVMFGLLGATELHVPGSLLTSVPVAKWFTQKRAKAASFAASGIAIGGLIFAFIHQLLLDSVGWRDTLAISAIVVLIGTVPIPLLLLRRVPEDIGLLPDGAAHPSSANNTLDSDPPSWTARQAMRTSSLWKLTAAYAIVNFSTGAFMMHRAPYWAEAGMSTGIIATVFAVDSVVFGLAGLSAGFFGGRISIKYLAVIAITAQAISIVIGVSWVTVPGLLISPIFFGGGAGINAVVQGVIWAEYFGRSSVGTIRAVTTPIILGGFALGPPVIGMLYAVSNESYIPGFWAATALLAGAAIIVATAGYPQDYKRAHKN